MQDNNSYGIFDVGSHMLRYGICGEDVPLVSELSVFRKNESGFIESFGGEAYSGSKQVERLVESSQIKDVGAISFITSYLSEGLGLEPPGVLFSLNLSMPLAGKLALIESYFDLTGFSGISLISSTCLSMYSTGRTTGLALNLGHDGCEIGALFEGNLIGSYSRFSPFGGRYICDQLQIWLEKQYPQHFGNHDFKDTIIANDIKVKVCTVTMANQSSTTTSQPYELPDGQEIKISPEARQTPNMFFEPAAFGLTCKSIPELVASSLNGEVHDLSISALKSTLVLTGGASLHPNLSERLDHCIKNSMHLTTPINLVATHERKFSSWIGGSILASLPTFKNKIISKQNFEEEGADRVFKRECAKTFC